MLVILLLVIGVLTWVIRRFWQSQRNGLVLGEAEESGHSPRPEGDGILVKGPRKGGVPWEQEIRMGVAGQVEAFLDQNRGKNFCKGCLAQGPNVASKDRIYLSGLWRTFIRFTDRTIEEGTCSMCGANHYPFPEYSRSR